jgi:N6-L-threonylcarbamoyladenine synthase
MMEAGIGFSALDAIGVTGGPGLIGAVLIGMSTAKALAFALGRPLLAVHHIKAHAFSAMMGCPELEPPFVSLVVSGGHTDIIRVSGYEQLEVIGRTRDDAAGEAFDKVARVLGLGYPGGQEIDKLAKEGDPKKIPFKRVMLEEGSLDFSFSGIKTAVLNYTNSEKQAGREIEKADVAASFQAAVIDVICEKTRAALRRTGLKKLTLGGGVAANSMLRNRLSQVCDEEGARLYAPPTILCTDNAAMVACAAYYDYKAGRIAPLDIDAKAQLDIC